MREPLGFITIIIITLVSLSTLVGKIYVLNPLSKLKI